MELLRAEFMNPLHIRITHGAFKKTPMPGFYPRITESVSLGAGAS